MKDDWKAYKGKVPRPEPPKPGYITMGGGSPFAVAVALMPCIVLLALLLSQRGG